MANNKFASSRSLGAYHISNNTVEYNPQRKSNFTLIISGLPTALEQKYGKGNIPRVGSNEADTTNVISNWQNEIIIALKECDVPGFSQSKIEIKRGNSTIKFPGKPEFKDINLSAYDFMGSNTKDALLAWQQLSYNSQGDFIGEKSTYKLDCTLYEYTPAGKEVRHWDIKGAWLSEVNIDSFSSEDDGVVTISATMVYDWSEIALRDVEA